MRPGIFAKLNARDTFKRRRHEDIYCSATITGERHMLSIRRSREFMRIGAAVAPQNLFTSDQVHFCQGVPALLRDKQRGLFS